MVVLPLASFLGHALPLFTMPAFKTPPRRNSTIILTLYYRTHASASYTASYAQMMVEFNCSRLVATLGLSSFVLGIAMGPFWSPLAEFYGRRPIYLCSFIGFLIFLIPTAVAQNIETVIVTRFLQGMAGSAFLSVSGGTVGDMFTRNTMQAPMAIFATAPFVGPATGPLAGGLINMYAPGWRWTHYVLMIMGGIMLVLVTLFIPETYRKYMPPFVIFVWSFARSPL